MSFHGRTGRPPKTKPRGGRPAKKQSRRAKPTNPVEELPRPPRGFNPTARKAWRVFGNQLIQRGQLDEAELLGLETLAQLYGDANSKSLTITQRRAAQSALLTYMKQFGLTPITRTPNLNDEVEAEDKPTVIAFEPRKSSK